MSACLTELPDPEAAKRLPARLAAVALLGGWTRLDMRRDPLGLAA
jgi:hypothetical protein